MGVGSVDAKGISAESGSNLVTDTVSDVLAFRIGVGSHQVETAFEVFTQLTSDTVIVTIVVSVGNIIRSDSLT